MDKKKQSPQMMQQFAKLLQQSGKGAQANPAPAAEPETPLAIISKHLSLTPLQASEHDLTDFGQGNDTIWFVQKGQVDISYSIAVEEPNPHWRRHHLISIPGEQMLLNLTESSQVKLHAIITPGSQLMYCSYQQLFELSGAEVEQARVELLTNWLAAMSSWCQPASLQPHTWLRMPADTAISVQPSQQLVAQQGLLWCPLNKAEYHFQDTAVIPTEHDGFFPITPTTGISRQTEMTITAITTAAWLQQASVKIDLARYAKVVVSLLSQQFAKMQEQQKQRVGQRDETLQKQFVNAFDDLAAVLEKERSIPQLHQEQPMIAALQTVLHDLDLHEMSERLAKETRTDLSLVSLAKRIGLLYRKISLSGSWWQNDRGPLLGYYGDDNKPCALIYAKKGYEIHDPNKSETIKIDAATVVAISPQAWMFYKPLPDRKLRIKDLFQFAKEKIHRDFTHFLLMALVSSLLSLGTPILVGWIFDPVIQDALTHQLIAIVAAMILIAIGMGISSFLQALIVARVEGRMDWVAQAGLWDRILKLPPAFFRRFQVGDFVYRAQGIEQMRANLSGALTQGTMSVLTAIFTFILLVYYEWHLALVALALVLTFVIITYFMEKSMLKHAGSIQEARGQLASVHLQLLNMVGKIRATGAERGAFSHWSKRYAKFMQVNYNLSRLTNVIAALRTVFDNLGLFFLFMVIGLQGHVLFSFFQQPTELSTLAGTNLQSTISTSHFISFNIAYGMFSGSVFALVNIAIQLLGVKALSRRLTPILEQEVEKTKDLIIPERVAGHVSVNNVSFRYDPHSDWILNNLSLTITPGQWVGIVGVSGCGKTTLMRLLLGFETPMAGSIYIDNQAMNTKAGQMSRPLEQKNKI